MKHPVITLALACSAVMPLAGCRNVFDVCGSALRIKPNFDSTSVGGTRTFSALTEGGGCGLTGTQTAAVKAMWQIRDTTVARISAVTPDDVITVTAVRPGATPIVAFSQGRTAVAYFQVN